MSSSTETSADTYILMSGELPARALSHVMKTLFQQGAQQLRPYVIGTSKEDALSGAYARVIDCTEKLERSDAIEVVITPGVSLVGIIKALEK